MMRLLTTGLLAAWAIGALAASPSQMCESGKNKEAGKYSYCRQRAEAKYTITGNVQAYQRALGMCAASIAARWPRIEAKANGACPSNTDLTAIQAAVDAHTAAVATALAGGSLPDCAGDLATCEGQLGTCDAALTSCLAGQQSQYLSTGQTTCSDTAGLAIPCAGTGQDGEFQKGLARSYTDNGDGTVSDNRTSLMWEKLSDDGSIHDKDNDYTWADAFAVKVAGLNQQTFAGYTDWRLPNINELLTLVDYGASSLVGPLALAISPEFNTGCVSECTVTTCSCTQSTLYGSSTAYQRVANNAMVVNLSDGQVWGRDKSESHAFRAVRGGF